MLLPQAFLDEAFKADGVGHPCPHIELVLLNRVMPVIVRKIDGFLGVERLAGTTSPDGELLRLEAADI